MGTLIIVGLGPGGKGQISEETLRAMQQAEMLILRTEVHPTVELLREKQLSFVNCDSFYEKGKDFEAVYNSIVNFVMTEACTKNVVYAVPGSPLVAERTVVLLRQAAQNKSLPVKILPSMSFLDLIYARLGIDPINGIRIIDAGDFEAVADAGRYPLIVTQVYSQMVASDLKLALMDVLPDEAPVVFLRNLGLPDEECREIQLFELDRQSHIDHLTSLYVPCIDGTMNVKPLMEVVKTLREPGGCPWDREQDHSSLRKGFVEEVYEFLEAVDDKDYKGMREELGDVLLQVVFHARLAEEKGIFRMQDVIDDIVAKLIHRHPHVYGTIEVDDSAEVLRNWEALKAQEKTERKLALDGIAKGLPALMRAYKLQCKAAKVGFDWPNAAAVWDKVEEELSEFKEAVALKEIDDREEELGDVLLTLVCYAQHLGLEPETALNRANNKFVRRFNYIEQHILASGKQWRDFSLEDMDKLWSEVKKTEK